MKLWGGRFQQETNDLVLQYTSSIGFDRRLAEFDIQGSMAHARMLKDTGIISLADEVSIQNGLIALLEDLHAGKLEFRVEDEDIHMNVERLLHEKIGSVAGRLHTARSRNDQVALDMHLFVKATLTEVVNLVRDLQGAVLQTARNHMGVVIPGYTHLQRAQPILLSHHLLAYFWMLERDRGRLEDAYRRTDVMPLGAGALAGTTFPIDRDQVRRELGFSELYENSLDAVSDRDYLVEFLSALSLLMMHLSRLSEELILWTSEEFAFVELGDAYCTGSSMMPQKKNPDVPELVRGKTGRVYGHLLGLLTVLKGLPLAYNKDLQEDKEGVFDAVDTVIPALILFTGMIQSMRIRHDRIAAALARDFSNATDVADYLAKKGMPFREAHAVVGRLVLTAIESQTNLSGLPLEVLQEASSLLMEDIYEVMTIQNVVNRRNVRGGTGTEAVLVQLDLAEKAWGVPIRSEK